MPYTIREMGFIIIRMCNLKIIPYGINEKGVLLNRNIKGLLVRVQLNTFVKNCAHNRGSLFITEDICSLRNLILEEFLTGLKRDRKSVSFVHVT